MRLHLVAAAALLATLAGCATAPQQTAAARPKNIIFFLGDGMGINTLTAARIYAVGEDGQLALDTLPESAFVKTFSNDAQVTDSAASMTAYMTGVKANNGVISMGGGSAAVTLAEMAKQRGMAAGVVTTTRVTDATPAATYAHVPKRQLESEIAASLVPGGVGYNAALGMNGLDVVFGGGVDAFVTRSDGRNLLAELRAKGYRTPTNTAELKALDERTVQPVIGLFARSDMSFSAVRDAAKEPSLAEMTSKAIGMLSKNPNGFFLMVEGGLIDLALHSTNAKRALQETVAFDQTLKAAIAQMQAIDPGLKNTLIVATADHDHTLLLNGYAKRTGPTTAAQPGVLGLIKQVADGKPRRDLDGAPVTIIGFGTGENRVKGSRASPTALTDEIVSADDYHQEAVVRMEPGNETHGGTDVYLGAIGAGAERFHGTIDNTHVFNVIKAAAGW
ncbi:alkaline phosphatase [Massilia sp. RP-1-19]|uniref:Alkaline phosphatase n=1 Tax=Massilia polaris TaxID=2728846 RepID=A0A848HQA7_9BURK|nr:alkaline phosphatase [Massilia polaris]NML63542.1 alkaline phosphatase [Massilia polaris]